MIGLPASFYSLVGQIFIIAIITFLVILALALWLAMSQTTNQKKSLPRLVLFILNLMYRPAKMLLANFHVDNKMVNVAGVDLMDYLCEEKYKKIPPERRIIVLPHCLRDTKCPGKIDARFGVKCKNCGKCGIGHIKEICDEKNIQLYICPGSSFVKRVVDRVQPEAVVGVACEVDLYAVMKHVTGKKIPMVGVLLSKSGCIETEVDWATVEEKLLLGIDDNISKAAS